MAKIGNFVLPPRYHIFPNIFLGAGDLVFVDNDLGNFFNVLKKLIDNFCTIVKLPNNNRHKVSEDVDQIWTSKEKKVFFSSRARSQEHIMAMEFANLGGKEERNKGGERMLKMAQFFLES